MTDHNFKVGDTVCCTDVGQCQLITEGKHYEVIGTPTPTAIAILDDNRQSARYSADRFSLASPTFSHGFSVGDQVRIRPGQYDINLGGPDDILLVVKANEEYLYFKSGTTGGWFPGRFEKVVVSDKAPLNEPHGFDVGDVVVLVNNHGLSKYRLGTQFTIEQVFSSFLVGVDSEMGLLHGSRFALVSKTNTKSGKSSHLPVRAKHGFSVGDRVRVVNNYAMDAKIGDEFTVTDVLDQFNIRIDSSEIGVGLWGSRFELARRVSTQSPGGGLNPFGVGDTVTLINNYGINRYPLGLTCIVTDTRSGNVRVDAITGWCLPGRFALISKAEIAEPLWTVGDKIVVKDESSIDGARLLKLNKVYTVREYFPSVGGNTHDLIEVEGHGVSFYANRFEAAPEHVSYRAVCLDPSLYTTRLTKGKVYTIISRGDEALVRIEDTDNGCVALCNPGRFERVEREEFRVEIGESSTFAGCYSTLEEAKAYLADWPSYDMRVIHIVNDVNTGHVVHSQKREVKADFTLLRSRYETYRVAELLIHHPKGGAHLTLLPDGVTTSKAFPLPNRQGTAFIITQTDPTAMSFMDLKDALVQGITIV